MYFRNMLIFIQSDSCIQILKGSQTISNSFFSSFVKNKQKLRSLYRNFWCVFWDFPIICELFWMFSNEFCSCTLQKVSWLHRAYSYALSILLPFWATLNPTLRPTPDPSWSPSNRPTENHTERPTIEPTGNVHDLWFVSTKRNDLIL